MSGSRVTTRIIAAAVVVGIVLAVVFALVMVTNIERSSGDNRVDRNVDAIVVSTQIQRLVLDSETATRGFILTHDERYLQPHLDARRDLPTSLVRFQQLVRPDGGAQAALVERLRRAIQDYVGSWADPTIARAREDQIPAVQMTAEQRTAQEEGKRRIDAIRTSFERFDSAQAARVSTLRENVRELASRGLWLGRLGVVLVFCLLGLYALYSRRMVAPVRGVSDAAGQLAAGDLSVRVKPRGTSDIVTLGTSFNRMADALQEQRDELETQNTELEAQQSELEHAVDALARQKARVELLHTFAQTIAAKTDIEWLGETALAFICRNELADVAVLYARNPVSSVYERYAAYGVSVERVPAQLRNAEGLGGRAAAERTFLTAAPGSAGMRVALLGGEQPLRHEAAVPLVQGKHVVGVVMLGRIADRPYSQEEQELLEQLGGQAAMGVSRARTLRSVERSANVNRAVIDAMPAAIALVDLEGGTLLENALMADLRREFPALSLVDDGDDPRGETTEDVALPDGRVLSRYVAPLDTVSDQMGRVVLLYDMTAERQAERLKDEFFALVSHELRTPLTSIIGYLEVALEDDEDDEIPLDPQRRHYLEVVDRNAQRLLRLVGDLLFVAQVEAGTLRLELGAVDLARVTREAVEAAQPRAADGGIALHVEPAERLVLPSADADRLAQMLDNLIANALKFTPAGGSVSVSLNDVGDAAELAVSDTGAGIAPSDQAHLFERFYRAASATEQGVPGVGLGLTIVQAIVQSHGGEISVDSALGVGTTFRVRLPHAPDADDTRAIEQIAGDATV